MQLDSLGNKACGQTRSLTHRPPYRLSGSITVVLSSMEYIFVIPSPISIPDFDVVHTGPSRAETLQHCPTHPDHGYTYTYAELTVLSSWEGQSQTSRAARQCSRTLYSTPLCVPWRCRSFFFPFALRAFQIGVRVKLQCVPPDARTGPLHCVPVAVLYADGLTPCGGVRPFAGLAFLVWALGFFFSIGVSPSLSQTRTAFFLPLRSSPGPAEDFEYYLAVFSSSSSPFFTMISVTRFISVGLRPLHPVVIMLQSLQVLSRPNYSW